MTCFFLFLNFTDNNYWFWLSSKLTGPFIFNFLLLWPLLLSYYYFILLKEVFHYYEQIKILMINIHFFVCSLSLPYSLVTTTYIISSICIDCFNAKISSLVTSILVWICAVFLSICYNKNTGYSSQQYKIWYLKRQIEIGKVT